MSRLAPTPASIAAMILTSPAWARIGLTVRDQRLRERAATEIAERVAADLEREPVCDDPRQMSLPDLA